MYNPPVQDMLFTLHDVLGFTHEDLDRETTEAVLDEAAKLARDILAPINKSGDEQGAVLKDGSVKTADGFKEAYAAYRDGGWNAVPFDPAYEGQGLPWAVAFAVQEMWQGANMSFGLCPLLNQGAIEAILAHGSDAQKDQYLPKMISGEWTGTMNLTESQAGSDLGEIRTKAAPQDDGSYKISGQKIFITYGDHDMADNIIHLVLARCVGAPDGVKGISLFIVPKILDDGARNTANVIGLEHKLGIHASPTCTMEFDGATGYLVGEENMGLKYMFTMMNNARLSVGLQGVAIAERSYQHAASYANDRMQGKSLKTGVQGVIADHADVRRMLLDMQARIWAGRLMAYDAALHLDKAHDGDKGARVKVDVLTPIIKSWCTDMSVEVASLGVQIHGGMGFIEETGAAQFYRDARILPIYEGTNGIQSADLVFRKLLRDDGAGVNAVLDEFKGGVEQAYIDELRSATSVVLKAGAKKDFDRAAWLSTPYLRAFGYITGAVYLSKAAMANCDYECANGIKVKALSEFYNSNILPYATVFISMFKE